jgi:hypothetical protein
MRGMSRKIVKRIGDRNLEAGWGIMGGVRGIRMFGGIKKEAIG